MLLVHLWSLSLQTPHYVAVRTTRSAYGRNRGRKMKEAMRMQVWAVWGG